MLVYSHEYIFDKIDIYPIPNGWLLQNFKRNSYNPIGNYNDILKNDIIKVSVNNPPQFIQKGWITYYDNCLCIKRLKDDNRKMVDINGNISKLQRSFKVKNPEQYLNPEFNKKFPITCQTSILDNKSFAITSNENGERVEFSVPVRNKILHVAASHDELMLLVVGEHEFIILDNPVK